jgi:hypothetical protein
MGRELNKTVLAIVTPVFRAIGFVVGNVCSLIYEPFYRRRIAEKQKQLEHEVQEQLSFLFAEHRASTTSNTVAGNLVGLHPSLVTISIDGLLLRFIRWREEFQVHVASERAPNDWHELSLVLSIIDPIENSQRGAIRDLSDVSRLLRPNLGRLKDAYSQERYAQLEEQLSGVHAFDRVVTRQLETEINRRLYPDR